jgi:hypothetical protein
LVYHTHWTLPDINDLDADTFFKALKFYADLMRPAEPAEIRKPGTEKALTQMFGEMR